jgi:1,4-dihydroxy-6-naphthoate synthase
MWAPAAAQRRFMPYDRILAALHAGQADCGVIIHESRFTFEAAGFKPVVDLGAWWEEQTGMPIALGCIAAHRRLPPSVVQDLKEGVRQSILAARRNPAAALPYVCSHAQEMTAEVLRAHIDTFVNEFSLDIGPQGRAAVQVLETRARQAGILP